MIGIIWYDDDWTRANEILHTIIKRYEDCGIYLLDDIMTKLSRQIILDNNDSWSIVKIGDSVRGKRCNISYIPESVKNSILVHATILPCTKLKPYTAIQYY